MNPVVGLLGGYAIAAIAAGVFGQKVADMLVEDINHNVQGVAFRRTLRTGLIFRDNKAARQKVAGFAAKVFRSKF